MARAAALTLLVLVFAAASAEAQLRATAVSAGNYHACAPLSDATVKCWGDNRQRQLGDGTRRRRLTAVAVQGLVEPDHLAPLAEAKAMLAWHARHRFCANCGVPTNVSQAGWKRECPACKVEHFPRTDPVVIMLAVDGDRCLLGRAGRFVNNMWSCLAGFIEPGESFEEAARRETLEEAGIVCGEVKYFRSQPWPFPMSLMIGCHAEALSRDIVVDRTELEDARWFSKDECAAMLKRNHPDGLTMPPPVAIAHHIVRAWVEDGIDFA